MDNGELPTEESTPAVTEPTKAPVSTLVRLFGPVLGSILLVLIEIIQVVVVAALIVWPIRTFLLMPFNVSGVSMEPTFSDREYVLVDRLSYRFHGPERGDVVVFRYPRDVKEYFIKRIIGLPGDTVEIRDGRVVVYNASTDAPVVLEEVYTAFAPTAGDERVTLNPDEYFVMGDNRGASLDSRNFGPVRLHKHIVGRVFLRGLPVQKFGFIHNDYDYHL